MPLDSGHSCVPSKLVLPRASPLYRPLYPSALIPRFNSLAFHAFLGRSLAIPNMIYTALDPPFVGAACVRSPAALRSPIVIVV